MPPDQHPIRELVAAADAFVQTVTALPADIFLRRYTDWSPRDVTAHLIGWNEHTLTACHGIPAGRLPFYFADMEDDFSHVNAASVARFAFTDRDELLAQLHATLLPLLDYLRALPPEEWDDGHGVANRLGQPVTVRSQIVPLTADYAGHRLEIESWAARS